jgi:hypothetical protein
MAYVVTGPVVVLPEATTGLTKYYYEGAILPDGLDKDRVQGVIDDGLVAEVDDPAAPIEGDEESGVPPVVAKPKQGDDKSAWVDYAVSKGAERADAEAMTKAELIELTK